MRKEKIGIYSILICLIGVILALIAGNFVINFRFIPEYINEEFNYSIFLGVLSLFVIVSLIVRILSKRKKIELSEEETLEDFQENYKLKIKIKIIESLSIFMIVYIISFILWMFIYDANNQYCYFLCSIKETIIMALLISFIFASFFLFIREVFLIKLTEHLKKK